MIAAIDNLGSNAAIETASLRSDRDDKSFRQTLDRLQTGGEMRSIGRQIDQADAQRAREAAEQLVASAFILPLLTQLRNDPFKSELLHGGRGEQMFGQQLDTVIADRIVKKSNLPIVDSLYRSITHQPRTVSRGEAVNQYG